ncbi:MAG TPA: hypothetical protein VJ768_03315, partial [Anaerolineales bacterium]|nr:hypothetical protein [Anaerolineales bacterium]
MLDNHYLIQQALRQIEEDLPSDFYRELPKLIGGPLDGFPRIYALAREVILIEKAHLDMDRVQRFIHAYQTVTVLTMGELWALPIMLRLGTLQSLDLATARITGLESEEDRHKLPKIDFSGLLKDDEVVANCIISLRLLSATNWKETFESLSVVESILRRDPAGYYSGMNFETRDQYRKVVEDLAFQTGKEEQVLAREAVRLAQDALDQMPADPGWSSDRVDGFHPPVDGFARLIPGPDGPAADPDIKEWPGFGIPAEAHTGHYLLGKGRATLEASIGYNPVWYRRAGRWAMSHPTAVYLGSITGLTLLLLSLLVGFSLYAGGEGWQLVLSAFLGLIPALTVAIKLVNWVLTKALKPRVLPKMDFSDSLPDDCLSLVVIPALLTSPDEVRSLLQQIELHYLRNLSPSLYFALLTDYADALQQHVPEDEELLKQASEGVDQLNAKYPRGSGNPFLLLHRERRWNPAEGLWIGWERKRGKLHELNLLILGKAQTSYATKIGDLSVLPDVKYVITLDADTILPNEGAARLIATLAHPLNRAVFDLREEKVVAGYTILQPRTEINPSSASQSWFTRIFAGDTGLDLYTLAVSEVYQDLFGEGIYVGKGIYDVRAFERSLYRSIPENALLSHDLFEGIYGRAGLATDIILIEDYPPNYLAYIQRLHRWVRGDWQLLPWLLPWVPSLTGLRLPNRLKLIDRWKIFENLHRSLVSPCLLLFFIIGWLWMPGPPWAWTLFGALALSASFMIDLFTALARLLTGAEWRRQASDLRDSAVRCLLSLAFLPYEAFLDLDAILTTLVRLFVTRKGMLQWTTSAQSARVCGEEVSLRVSRKRMAIGLLFSITLALVLALSDIQALFAATPLLVLWLSSSEIAYRISRPIRHLPQPLSGDEREEL